MPDDTKFTRGLFYNQPHAKAPDYVIASLSFNRTAFIGWLNQQEEDAKGYIKVDILRAKNSGKIYGKLNDWKPDQSRNQERPAPKPELAPETLKAVDEFGGEVVEDDVPF
jgi:hypothetical protein